MKNQNADCVSCPNGDLYTVRKGDTFSEIASRYGMCTAQLAELNPYVEVDKLSIGQILCVPREKDCPDGYTVDSVQSGESYADLLIKHDISYQAFRLSNPRLEPAALTVGQSYCLPPDGTRRLCAQGAVSYTVGQDETLSSVAQKLNVTPGRLLRLNPSLAPSDFREGQQICTMEG